MWRFPRSNKYSQMHLSRNFNSSSKSGYFNDFWKWTTQERPNWKNSYQEAAVMCCIFGITGSSSIMFIRPSLKYLGIDVSYLKLQFSNNSIHIYKCQGTFIDGPNSYRIGSIWLVSPIYALILMTIVCTCFSNNFCERSNCLLLRVHSLEDIIILLKCL